MVVRAYLEKRVCISAFTAAFLFFDETRAISLLGNNNNWAETRDAYVEQILLRLNDNNNNNNESFLREIDLLQQQQPLPCVPVFVCRFNNNNGLISVATTSTTTTTTNSTCVTEDIFCLDSDSVVVVVKDSMWPDLWQVLLLLLFLYCSCCCCCYKKGLKE